MDFPPTITDDMHEPLTERPEIGDVLVCTYSPSDADCIGTFCVCIEENAGVSYQYGDWWIWPSPPTAAGEDLWPVSEQREWSRIIDPQVRDCIWAEMAAWQLTGDC
jgi:hypothetical protein